MQPLISWDAPEHIYKEKTADWYWAIGIISITSSVLAIIFNNVIFGIMILVCAFALVTHATVKPRIVHYEINDRGVVIDDLLYPFVTLDSFWVDVENEFPKLLIKSQKMFMPYITIHIEGVHPDDVRDVMLKYITETEHKEPLSQILMEKIGL